MELFKNKKILIIGDVMIDSYLFGNVERISPEAPVPIVDIIVKQDKLGGAANVASNILNLGGTPILCSTIGKDQKGELFLSIIKKLKMSTKYICQSNNRITTTKTRIIGNNHQMLRIDEEIKNTINNNEEENLLSMINEAIINENIDSILFQDYDKGVLNKNIIHKTINIAKSYNIPVIVDPKKINFLEYKNSTLFKPNYKEFKEGLNLYGNNRIEILEKGSKILHNNGIKIIFVTLSENGIYISYKDKKNIISKIIPGIPRDVVDVSGAGDTVASVASMLINDINIEEIAKISNIAGGLVCEEIGVVPIDRKKLLKEYKKLK